MQEFKFPELSFPQIPEFGSMTPQDEPAKERPVRPFVKQPKVEPKPKEAEALGFITNLPRSILNITKSVFIDLPKAIADTTHYYATAPEGTYAKDFNLMLRNNNGLGSMLWHELSDYYTKDFWYNFNEDPGRFLQDAASLASGVGVGAKLSGASKIAVGAQKAAEWIDPLSASFKLTGKALAKPLEAIGIGEHTKDLENIARTRASKEALASAAATKEHLFAKLSPEETERLRRLIILGDPADIEQALLRSDNVAKRLKLWSDRISKTEEPFWKSKQFLLDDDDMVRANAKAIEVYTKQNPINGMVIDAKAAEQLIKAGKLKPTYMSMYRLKNQALDLFDAMNEFGAGKRGLLGRLENRVGRGDYLKDVDEIMARQIHSFHQAKYKLNLLDETKEFLLSKGKILLARTPEEAEKARLLGYRRLDDAFYKKYWESFNRATALQSEAIKRAEITGANTATALAQAREAFEKLEAAGKVDRLLDKAEVYVPAHVAAWLNRELAPISKGWQMYDRWMGRFKSAVTVFNPRYWSSVIFGNALLATMYGLSPDMARIAWKYRGDMPIALKQLAEHDIFLKDLNIYDKWSKRAADKASALDNLFKSGIYVSELAKDAVGKFYTSQMDVIQAVKLYSQAPEALAEVRVGIAALRNKVAVGLEARDAAYKMLKKQEKRMTHELAKLMELKQLSSLELAQAIDARADVLGKAFSHVTVTAPRYTYFADSFVRTLKGLRTRLNQQPHLVDNAGVVSAIDSALHAVAQGKPELLRHSVAALKKAVSGGSPLKQREARLSVLLDMVGKAEEKIRIATADTLDSLSKIGTLQSSVPKLEKMSAVADRAIDTANRFYGSFYALSPFERQVLRRVIPFYTFTKAMTKLAFQFPFLYPKRTFVISHLARAWNDIMHDDNSFMPSWSKNYIPVGVGDNADVVMMRLGSFTPLANVRMGQMGGHDIPSIVDLASQHPFIRVAFEMKGGIPEWTKRPLSPGDSAVRLDSGEVVEWTGTGFKTKIAQPTVWKSLFGMFPQSQLIHALISQYAQTDRGWLFNPDPIKGPSGKERYPRELSDILLTYTLAPTTTISRQDLERRERVYVATVVREFQREIRTAPPERRESLINALRAWSSMRREAVDR